MTDICQSRHRGNPESVAANEKLQERLNRGTFSRDTPDGRHSTEYVIWISMRVRCNNLKSPAYSYYGGRGIKVCKRWNGSFKNFLRDMGRRPPGKTLDRYPDKDGDYKPSNCRWATRREQQNNTRANRLITARGQTLTATEWAARLGVDPDTLRGRIDSGWTHERTINEPIHRRPANAAKNMQLDLGMGATAPSNH
jgi:hypothetical protein